MYVELLYAIGKNFHRALAEMIRHSIVAAVGKYPEDTTVILPNDKEFHRPIIDKLFDQ